MLNFAKSFPSNSLQPDKRYLDIVVGLIRSLIHHVIVSSFVKNVPVEKQKRNL